MEMPAKQTPAASSEMVKLIRKLRWVGLEEKAEQLEKELEQETGHRHRARDTKRDRLAKGREPRCATRHVYSLAPRIGNLLCRARPPAPNQHKAVAIRSSTP